MKCLMSAWLEKDKSAERVVKCARMPGSECASSCSFCSLIQDILSLEFCYAPNKVVKV